LLAACPDAAAQVNVSRRLPGNEAEVSIAINPTNPENLVIAGHEPLEKRFRVLNTFYTANGGRTWSLVPLAAQDAKPASALRFDPAIAFDANGNAYVAYGVAETTRTTVVVCVSTPDKANISGKSYTCKDVFTAPNHVTATSNVVANDKWYVATGPRHDDLSKQVVYVAWSRFTTATTESIVVRRSTGAGSSLAFPAGPLRFVPGGDGGHEAVPAVGPNGELYIVWHDRLNGKILLARSDDGGSTFQTLAPSGPPGTPPPPRGAPAIVATLAANLDFTTISAQPHRGIFNVPSIAIDGREGPHKGRVYVAYVDRDGDPLQGRPDTGIYLSFSDNKGVTWPGTNRLRVNADPLNNQFHPWVAVDQKTGLVAVDWYDAREDLPDPKDKTDPGNQEVKVFLRPVIVKDDGTLDLRPEIRVTPKPSNCGDTRAASTPCGPTGNPSNPGSNDFLEYIGLAVFNCLAFPVWSDNSLKHNNLDFYSAKIALPCPSSQDAERTIVTGSAHGTDGRAERGGIRILGHFTVGKDLNLGASAVTILRLFDEGNGHELVHGLPIPLSPQFGTKRDSETYRTAPLSHPTVELTITKRKVAGEYAFTLNVVGATIVAPALCPTANLSTSFTVNDPFDRFGTPAVLVTADQTWRCSKRGTQFEYMRAP
jgi:hypothetical protein